MFDITHSLDCDLDSDAVQ